MEQDRKAKNRMKKQRSRARRTHDRVDKERERNRKRLHKSCANRSEHYKSVQNAAEKASITKRQDVRSQDKI